MIKTYIQTIRFLSKEPVKKFISHLLIKIKDRSNFPSDGLVFLRIGEEFIDIYISFGGSFQQKQSHKVAYLDPHPS